MWPTKLHDTRNDPRYPFRTSDPTLQVVCRILRELKVANNAKPPKHQKLRHGKSSGLWKKRFDSLNDFICWWQLSKNTTEWAIGGVNERPILSSHCCICKKNTFNLQRHICDVGEEKNAKKSNKISPTQHWDIFQTPPYFCLIPRVIIRQKA